MLSNLITWLIQNCVYLGIKDAWIPGCYWWLIRVTLVVTLGFCPKILGGGRDLQMVLLHSMNVGSVVGIPWWRYSNPTICKRICLSFFGLTVNMCTCAISHGPEPPLWDFHNSSIVGGFQLRNCVRFCVRCSMIQDGGAVTSDGWVRVMWGYWLVISIPLPW